MRIIFTLSILLIATISYGQSNYFKLPSDTIYNEIDFNLHFKSMVKALPNDYSLTPIIYHKYQINDSIINYMTFNKIWWGDIKINQSNFEIKYKQDSLFLNLYKKLPEFDLVDLSGKSFNSSQLMGEPTLITYWATGCTGCIEEFPQLDKLREKYGDKVNFIAICFNSSDEIIGILKKNPLNFYHLANGRNYASNILKTNCISVNLFLDKNGYIREIKSALPVEFDKTTSAPKMTNNLGFDKILEKLTKL